MAITSRVRIKANLEGDFVYGQEYENEPTIIQNWVVSILPLTTTPLLFGQGTIDTTFLIIPPAGNTNTIFVSRSNVDPTPLALHPTKVSSISTGLTANLFFSASAPVSVQVMRI